MVLRKIIFFIFIAFTFKSASTAQDSMQLKIDYFISQAKFDSAKIYIQENLNDIDQKHNSILLKYQLVKVLFIQSDYNEALKQAYDALDNIDDKNKRVKFNFIIACIYSAISDYSKSIEYFDFVIKDSKDSSLIVQTHLLSSELYLELKDSTKSIQSLTEAYKITSHSDMGEKIKGHVSMQYHFFSQKYEICKQENLKVLRDSSSFLSAKIYAFSMMGECLIQQDSLLEATHYLDEFLKLTFKTNDPEQIKIAANKLIEVYEKLGLQEKANTYHKIYNEAENDSLSFSIDKYRDLYNVEKNRELRIAQNNFLRRYLFWGLLLLVSISTGIYYLLNKRNVKKIKVDAPEKTSVKKIVINDTELNKIKDAVDRLISQELFLIPKITRKSFCIDHKIKSERYLSHYINENYKQSFSVFLNELRIEYAFQRIQNDSKFRSYKIEVIAKESGFGSKKSFERVFLSKYEITPFKMISNINN